MIRSALAETFGLEERQVRVIPPDIGGGFGYKNPIQPEEIAVCWLAMRFRRPIRWTEDRIEHLTAGANCREHHYDLTLYGDERGRMLGLDAAVTIDAGAYSVWPNTSTVEGAMAGGILTSGIWIAFAVNAVSFAGVILVLLAWRRETTESSRGKTFRASLIEGVHYVVTDRLMRNVMVGVMLFVIPASALWSLLPLVARQRLNWDADGFGLLVATVGVGAVTAAWCLPTLQQRFGLNRTRAGSMTLFAIGLAVLSGTTTGWIGL